MPSGAVSIFSCDGPSVVSDRFLFEGRKQRPVKSQSYLRARVSEDQSSKFGEGGDCGIFSGGVGIGGSAEAIHVMAPGDASYPRQGA